ncbi:MAG: 4-hydroxy-3-methylbut-2-enyl diphosphate reductase, partial [Bacteroidales bacterium]|nr:4-hydroxy-3-methylbut-2-enyl diphosphate reductase [Bacteroidales bacterium]
MKIEINKASGFCFGVENTVDVAEAYLKEHGTLYCLGDMVHNQKEIERMESLGLVTISREQYNQLKDATVLLRAHGEPPETYEVAKK